MDIKTKIIYDLKEFSTKISIIEDGDNIILKSNSNKNELNIYLWEKENTLEYDNWHAHYDNPSENSNFLNAIIQIVNGQAILEKVFINENLLYSDLLIQQTDSEKLPEIEYVSRTGKLSSLFFFKSKRKKIVRENIKF